MSDRSGGFYSDEHKARFRRRSVEVRRGGPASRLCGARTRTGGRCGRPPLAGHTRCLRHAGPHAARAHRVRQLKALAVGKLSVEAFEHQEARRATNAVRNAWRRDPWLAGATIDLGEHEERFQRESGVARLNTIAPAVLDWLRWRYRRLQIDRHRDEDWARVLFEEYPRRVQQAGTPPPEFDPSQQGAPPRWKVGWTAPQSKRHSLDVPRARAKLPITRPFDDPAMVKVSEGRLARVAYEQREVLAPLLKCCAGPDEQRTLVRALAVYLDRPDDRVAYRRWAEIISGLQTPGQA